FAARVARAHDRVAPARAAPGTRGSCSSADGRVRWADRGTRARAVARCPAQGTAARTRGRGRTHPVRAEAEEGPAAGTRAGCGPRARTRGPRRIVRASGASRAP